MSKKSCQPEKPSIPAEFKGIQVNCCKNATCENFGLTPEKLVQTEAYKNANKNKEKRQVREKNPFYVVSGGVARLANIQCKLCLARHQQSEHNVQYSYILKNNEAEYEEYDRISSYLNKPEETCPNSSCPTQDHPELANIKKRGFTAAGVQLYHCSVCKTSFTGRPINREHQRTEIDKQLFKLLVSQVSFIRIEYIIDIDYRTLQRRLSFLQRQCLAFVAERERKLTKMKRTRMYLSTDRQVQSSNWTNRKEKMNCEFYGIGTADLYSGYVLAFNFNYDPDVDPEHAEAESLSSGDHFELKHHRKFARIWLKSEFEDAKKQPKSRPIAGSLEEEISPKSIYGHEDDEGRSSEYFDNTKQAPVKGVEVHNEYNMIAHFHLIKKLTAGVEKTRFFMDQDIGMGTWYLGTFKDEIAKGNSDGFFVAMVKGLTVDEKRTRLAEAKEEISKFAGRAYDSMSYEEQKHHIRQMILQNMERPFVTKKTGEKWIDNPAPSMAEPGKKVYALTNIRRYDLDHQANLYRKASLHAIDRFFMQIRRKVRMFERATKSGTSKGRMWNG